MIKFYMLVGLPASGKSTLAQEIIRENRDIKLFSSDKLREELWGDENTQGDNSELFNELHRRIKECLANGNDCIYDATNISAKRRTAFLNDIKKYKTYNICLFALTGLDKCKENNKLRNRKVPDEVIENMYKNIDIPQYREGWNEIIINRQFDKECDFSVDMDNMRKIPHDNPHHLLSIGDHMCACANYIIKNYATKLNTYSLNCIVDAAFFHDIGKPFTKQFKDGKGNECDIAHYYNHENVSAYLYLLKYCSNEELKNELIGWSLFEADLIGLHMKMFDLKTEKSKEKFIKLVGKQTYDALCILHEADMACS